MSRHNEYNTLCFYAFRYALGRMTYSVGDVADILRRNIKKIDPYNRELMIKEINNAINDGHAGMACDIAEWKHLLWVLNDEQSTKISGETQP